MLAVLACALGAAQTQAEQLLETDGIVLYGTVALAQENATKCRLVKDKYTEEEWESMQHNVGKPLHLWKLKFSVENQSGKALDHLIALYSIDSPDAPCNYWDPINGISIEWGGSSGFIQETAEPFSMAPGDITTKEINFLTFHADTPRFADWSVSFTYADEAGQAAAAKARGTPSTQASRPQGANTRNAAAAQSAQASVSGQINSAIRAEETCDGKPEGSECWMELENQSGCFVWNGSLSVNETATWTGACTNGIANGEGTLKFVWGEKREKSREDSSLSEGGIIDGKRGGNWSVHFLHNGTVAEGPYVDGKSHGNWVMRWANGDVAEGPYVDGKRNGNWVVQLADGGVQEGPYVDGKSHGNWVFKEADGDIEEGSFANGKGDGEWIHRNAKSGLVVTRTYGAGELIDLQVNNPGGRRLAANPLGRATVTGAFGLAFGNNLAPLRSISHPHWRNPDWTCLDGVSQSYRFEFDWLNNGESDLQETIAGENDIFLDIENPPNPIPGATFYQATINVWDGHITGFFASISNDSVEACNEEVSRLNTLLEEKYGECINPTYKPNQVGYTPIGQCDTNGLIEREVRAYCFASDIHLRYDVLSDAEHRKIIDAWMRTGRPGADDL